jgi:putative transposase
VNHKRVYRLYCQEGLNLRVKRPKRRARTAGRMVRVEAGVVNEHWSMDFVSDALFDGRRFRVFAVVDNFSRECLGVCLGQSLRGEQAVTLLKRIQMKRRAPKSIRLDNGPEFISKSLELWAPMRRASPLTSPGPESPRIVRLSNRSMEGCVVNI